ncbi:hypothetical protein ACIRPK_16495 [Kitasatospora sp. NPDC101801]|uniref:hypothetical protein n=1 Tax=Kitasatospora sp. NPDC101801 TaxID=3364103 RepID=UPI00381F595C
MGAGPASLEWWWTRWPAGPDLDLPPGAKHAEVQIAVHSADLFREVPADAHTFHVHVGPHETDRADRIAAQVGLHVVGPGLRVGWAAVLLRWSWSVEHRLLFGGDGADAKMPVMFVPQCGR